MMWNDELIQEVGTAIEEMPEQTREIIQSVFFSGDEISGGGRLSGYIYKYSEDVVKERYASPSGTLCRASGSIPYYCFNKKSRYTKEGKGKLY